MLNPAPGQAHTTAMLTLGASTCELFAFLANLGSCHPGAGASWGLLLLLLLLLFLLAQGSLLDITPAARRSGRAEGGKHTAADIVRIPSGTHGAKGSFCTAPPQPSTLGLSAILRICTGLMTFSTSKPGQPVPPAHRRPAGHVPGQHQSWDRRLGPRLPPRQLRLTIYTATKPCGSAGNHCLPEPGSAPAQLQDRSSLWHPQPASGWVFPLNQAPPGRLARSGCLFGVSK